MYPITLEIVAPGVTSAPEESGMPPHSDYYQSFGAGKKRSIIHHVLDGIIRLTPWTRSPVNGVTYLAYPDAAGIPVYFNHTQAIPYLKAADILKLAAANNRTVAQPGQDILFEEREPCQDGMPKSYEPDHDDMGYFKFPALRRLFQ